MAKILFSPSKYVQGAGELARLASHIESLGKTALIIITESGFKRVGEKIESSFKESNCSMEVCHFNGECSEVEVNRIIDKYVTNGSCDIIVGIGGGKIVDTAKAVAYYTKKPVVVCPTIASTDAPCSALSVLYTEEGVFDKYLFLLATYYEARACKISGATSCAGGKTTQAAMALASLCLDTLLKEGLKAKIALEAGACTEAVENIIEANTLLSGIGFESAGLAGAHAIHNGLTVLEECHHMYHGEKVAFGTVTQLVLENAEKEEIEKIYKFCIEIGLPVTLAQLGATDVTKEQLLEVAKAACVEGETIHNMPFEVTSDKVYNALITADALGKYYLQKFAQ